MLLVRANDSDTYRPSHDDDRPTGARSRGGVRERRGIVRGWRRSRPFWGGLLTLLSGLEMLSIPFSPSALPLLLHSPQAGLTYLLSITMIVLGVLIWAQVAQRVFLGVMAILLSIASVIYSNMGGFLIGLILGLVGGALAASWTPVPNADESGSDRLPDDAVYPAYDD